MLTKLNHAGGYRVIRGSKRYPNLTTAQRKQWLACTRSHLKRTLKTNDWRTRGILDTAQQLLGLLMPHSLNRQGVGKTGTPRERAETLIAHILKQKRYSAVDIVSAALAAQIQCTHDGDLYDHMPPLSHRPYFISVQVGRAVHHLLKADKPVMRVYDDGHGNTGERPVKYVKLQLQSRYVCQQIQRILCEEIGYDFCRVEGQAVASAVAQATALREAKRATLRPS